MYACYIYHSYNYYFIIVSKLFKKLLRKITKFILKNCSKLLKIAKDCEKLRKLRKIAKDCERLRKFTKKLRKNYEKITKKLRKKLRKNYEKITKKLRNLIKL